MQFIQRKRRQPPAIIIVALVDILIVLLIFLMVTTAFKQQPAVKISLPESSQSQKSGAQENPPLVATIDKEGNLRFGPDSRPVTVEQLRTELQAAVAKDPKTRFAIGGDQTAPWGKVIKVMDAAKEAGLQTPVNAFTKDVKK
ncbi:MAG TPA: biopolymer transporter ExbD [Candidatus Dormibacteraeota bacterium]|nr:biopolymer transporter ExbD [Candidatus Dormibacteraeota bacterium]